MSYGILTLIGKGWNGRGVPQSPIRLSGARWMTPSWEKVGVSYRQDLDKGTCDCPVMDPEHKGFQPGVTCKHLRNAFLCSFPEQLERARQLSPAHLRAALIHYQNRPDIVAACRLVL